MFTNSPVPPELAPHTKPHVMFSFNHCFFSALGNCQLVIQRCGHLHSEKKLREGLASGMHRTLIHSFNQSYRLWPRACQGYRACQKIRATVCTSGARKTGLWPSWGKLGRQKGRKLGRAAVAAAEYKAGRHHRALRWAGCEGKEGQGRKMGRDVAC